MTIPRVPLGSQGLEVSAQGLGCMGMSQSYGVRDDDAESIATLHRALDLGVTFWDTSDVYGPHTNERLLSQVLAERRDEVQLATKFGICAGGDRRLDGRPEYVRSACDASLGRLGVDVIDLWYQHRVDPQVPVEETWGAMAEMVAAGKVRYLGISEPAPDTLRRAHAVHPVTALQNEWSLWERQLEVDIVPLCRELGIGIVPFSPLGRGFLTGAVTSPDDFPPDDMRRTLPRFSPENFGKNLDLVRVVQDVAAEKGCSPAQLALAWVHAQGPDVVPIPGTKRRSYLEENVGALDVSLTAEELALVDRAMPQIVGDRYADMRWVRIEAPPAGS